MCRLQIGRMLIALCVAALLLPKYAMAEDYSRVVDRILDAGKDSGYTRHLEFLDGGLHQYAVATPSDDFECDKCIGSLTFIEEHWSKAGENDVIDQWIVQVEPTMYAQHGLLVETSNSLILETRQLSTEGAEDVVKRITEKATGVRAPEHP
jgi:hypothetical protein